MYQIGNWYLTIKVKNNSEFFTIYDEAIQQVNDITVNKKWYRSPARTFCGVEFGLRVYLIPLNRPTLKKILQSG